MGAVYLIEPDAEAGRVSRVLEAAGLGTPLPAWAREARVHRVEVRGGSREWRLYVRAPRGMTQDGLALLEERLLRRVPGLTRVTFVLEGGLDEKASPETTTAYESAPEPPAVSPPGDDIAAYMDQILRRAQEFVALVEAEERSAEKPQGGSQRRRSSASLQASNSDDVLLGRTFSGEATPMAQVTDEERQVILQGQVLQVEVRELKSGRRIVSFDFTDRTDSFTARVFDEPDGPLAQAVATGRMKPGVWVRARGSVQIDRFSQELTLMPRDVMLIAPPQGRRDRASEKRVELHLHTKMSALDGAIDVGQLIAKAKEWGHEALAITDHGVVQAFPDAFAAAKAAGIKLIYGVEGYLCDRPDRESRVYHIVILAKNQTGLVNLYRLISLSHLHYFYRRPRIPREELIRYREGLILGSACEAGELYQAVLRGESAEVLRQIASFYDYLEIQPLANTEFLIAEGRVSSREDLMAINRRIYQLGKELGKPVVATCDAHFLDPEDSIYRQIIMASHGFADVERPTPLYLRTTEEMLEEFAYLGPEAAYEVVVTSPRLIAAMVEPLRPVPEGFHPPRLEGAEDEIRNMAVGRAKAIYGDPLPELIQARLEKELKSIIGNGFASLYLIAHKLVKKSQEDGYYVGSRGSVGSSLVATMCGITEVNPLPPHYICPQCHFFEVYADGSVGAGPDLPRRNCPQCGTPLHRDGFDIPFETFLGFKGDKVPDIDLNFSGEYQARAHKYVEELFGAENVFRAGTISGLAEKTAYGYVRKFLQDKGVTPRTAEINRLVKGILGVRKTTGQHPGGMMVVPRGRDIHEFTPVQYPANDRESGTITTHFDFHAIHDNLVKLDVLGHDGPTMIRMLEDLTGVKASTIPLDDPKTMAIFSGLESLGVGPEDAGGEVGTLGIPEYNTPYVRQMLVDTRPRTFADLVRIMGLSHGEGLWLGNAQELIRAGTITLSQAIGCRDDIMVYLIQRGLSETDAFRIMETVRKSAQTGKFLTEQDIELMRQHGVPEWYIESCRKITYMFPKGHAVAYAMMAFWQAYYKVHFPLAFYAAYFTAKAEEFDADLVLQGPAAVRQALESVIKKGNEATAKEKAEAAILEVVLEAFARGVRFLPVDLYRSDATRFRIEIVDDLASAATDGRPRPGVLRVDQGRLRPPLASLSGLGLAAARSLVTARAERPFTSVEDLRRRAGLAKNVIDILSRHGSLAGLPETDQLSLF